MSNEASRALIDPRRERAGFLNGVWLRATGRSWWQAKYSDGRELSEWQTLKDRGNVESSRWQETPRKGMRALRLLCPNGEAGEVSATSDHKLFQLRQVAFIPGQGRGMQLAHLIGVIHDINGNCDCFVWEPPYMKPDALGKLTKVEGRLIGPFQDNVLAMRYGNIGPLGLESLGLVL